MTLAEVTCGGTDTGMLRTTVLLFGLAAASPIVAGCDEEAQLLGRKFQAAGAAIQDPNLPGAMRSITDLGTDSRYYTMVRGWLAQQLKGDRSIVVSAGVGRKPRIEARIRFLEEAIRAIDLE